MAGAKPKSKGLLASLCYAGRCDPHIPEQSDGEAGGALVYFDLVLNPQGLNLLDVAKSEDCRRSDSGVIARSAADFGARRDVDCKRSSSGLIGTGFADLGAYGDAGCKRPDSG